jgi:tetratricopeptide (TPR) repeat protein
MSSSQNGFDADELLALARLAIERNDIESALAKLKQALAVEKPLAEAQSMAARVYAQLGLFERAKDLFAAYIAQQPDALVERFQLGMAHFDLGEIDAALQLWDAVLKKDPVHPPALFYSALALAQRNKLSDAKLSLDKLLQSAAADNLYFGRGKDLLNAINSGQFAAPQTATTKTRKAMPKDVYQVEH